ncbi:PaaI family thioesterase [Candidatus Mycobacterium wuenschmannii]|uniref:Acyl-coenzyme A thioesterase THEM4 n=1 Tax=Candidatus Mycobacterium wuenschmannii TaxID=3027808 RepID=A0ABY8VVP6_9MYCO|nr:PaaI family thioesterase [Candidatus Mycobacterium wuenschmannii]WIM86242.1 PaaI family thioesterase [Candidatus Mycobacterium wuenschmannii]
MAELEAMSRRLADSVRRLVDAAIRTQISAAAIGEISQRIDCLTEELSASLMPGSFGVQVDDGGRLMPWGNVMIGLRNAVAPPLVVDHGSDGSVSSEFTLGAAYEGPPGMVHGGVCAMVLDHVLGATAHQPGRPAVTGTLRVRFLRGTPLGQLRTHAHVDRVEGVKTFAVGHLADADGITVEAEGVFIHPRQV